MTISIFIDVVKISLNRIVHVLDDDDWHLAKENANSTECLFQRKERQSQELHQSVSFHIKHYWNSIHHCRNSFRHNGYRIVYGGRNLGNFQISLTL